MKHNFASTLHEILALEHDASRPLVISHGRCLDGYGSVAAVLYSLRPETFVDVVLIPNELRGSAEVAAHVIKLCKDRDVTITDFAFHDFVLADMEHACKYLLVIDHHRASHDYIPCTTKHHLVYSADFSGAVLTWKTLCKGTHVPALLNYIQAGDLYTWDLDDAREVMAGVYYDLMKLTAEEAILKLAKLCEYSWTYINAQREIGGILLEYRRSVASELARNAATFQHDGHTVVYCNAHTADASIIGETLLAEYSSAAVALVYYILPGQSKMTCSFRSRKDGVNVRDIAAKLGGGGHHNAAGATFRFDFPYGSTAQIDFARKVLLQR